ncbi:MAG: phytoene desaturase family protein [Promethearchaeota archaeon]
MKKIIIIGSGIGGSGIGALISKERSHQIILFEKNDIIGGRCGSYKKIDDLGREWIFDIGCHIISTCDKGPLGEILNRCGKKDSVKWSYTKNPGPRVNIMGMELIKIDQKKRKKSQKENEVKKKKKETFTQYITRMPLNDCYKYDKMSLSELFTNYFGQRRGIMERIMYTMQAAVMFGTAPDATSAGEFLRCVSFNNRMMAMGYPLGGTGIIPETFCDIIKKNGGTINIGKEGRVRKIIVENNEVRGVEVGPDNEFYKADIIIANSDIKTTVFELVGEKYFSSEYVNYIKALQWGGQVCSLKLGIDKIVTNHKMLTYMPKIELSEMKGKSLYDIDFTQLFFKEEVPEKTGLLIVPTSNHDPNLAPKGCQNIHTVTATALGDIVKWSPEDEKKWEKCCLDTLFTLWPEIEGHIVVQDFIATSKLAAQFGKEGAGTGIAQSITQVGKNRPSMISPIKGLYYCSGDAGGWGIGTELPARAALELFKILKDNNFSNELIFQLNRKIS